MLPLTEKIIKASNGYAVVAFDVFDTLLKRDIARPVDLFALMEQQPASAVSAGFAAKRGEAERAARAAASGEVTLAQIYAQPVLQGATPQAELAAELAAAVPNLPLRQACRTCHAQGKKIYAISDIYLPVEQIEAMLQKCGYDFLDGIFVSSVYGVQKRSGKLFRLFLHQTGTAPHEVLFVGDNARADALGAALAGVRCFLLPKPALPRYTKPGAELAQRAACAFAANRLPGLENDGTALGFEVLGPLLVGFTQWLDALHRQTPGATLWFLARDMALVRRCHAILYPQQSSRYLQVSRRSLAPALLQRPMNAAGMALFADALPRQQLTVQQVLDFCGFAHGAWLPNYQSAAFVDLRTRPLPAPTQKFLATLAAYSKTPAGQTLRENAASARDYLVRQGFSDGDILVDIGSGGTTQRIVEDLTGVALHGAYLACDQRLRQAVRPEAADVYLFDGDPAPLAYWMAQPLLERLISEQSGATLGYRTKGDAVCPLQAAAVAQPLITAMQQGALEFVQQWQTSILCGRDLTAAAAIAPFLRLACAPRFADANALRDLAVEDGGVYPLVAAGRFVPGLRLSRWKVGFLTCRLRLPLPYYRLYAWLKPRC